MRNNLIKNEILDTLDIQRAIKSMIPDAVHRKSILSPLREEKSASFAIDFNTGKWNDFGGEQGDIIDLVKKVKKVEFVDALDYLSNYAATVSNDNPQRTTGKQEDNKSNSKLPEIRKNDMTGYVRNLETDKYTEISEQISNRNLNKETLAKHGVGAKTDWSGRQCFIFPYNTNDNGSVATYKQISYVSGKKPKNGIVGNSKAILYPEEHLKDKNIFLCEGELDVFALLTYNIKAVTGTAGALTFNNSMAEKLAGKNVTIIYDNDDAGQKGAQKAAQLISQYAESVRLAQWDVDVEGYDVCDFSAGGRTGDELAVILNSAVPFKSADTKPRSEISDQSEFNSKVIEAAVEFIYDHGNFRDNLATEFMFDEFFRNGIDESTICCVDSGTQRRLYLYKNDIWEKVSADKVKNQIRKLVLRKIFTNSQLNQTVDMLKAAANVDYKLLDKRSDLINLSNCAYDLYEYKTIEHSPVFYFTHKTEYDFDENALCPFFDKTLKDYSDNDPDWIKTFWEIAGLCLTDRTHFQKMFFFYGGGGRGKGALLRVLTKLTGNGRTKSGLKTKNLNKDFYKKALIGKHLAIAGDLPPFMVNIDFVKELTGEDRQSTDVKFGDEIEFTNKAKMIFATNTLTEFSKDEPIKPITRRIIILKFDQEIKKSDGRIEDKLTAELPGIFNKAIVGLKRLIENNDFTDTVRGIQLVKSYEQTNRNYIEDFFDSHLIADPNGSVFSIEIYQAFLNYMSDRVPGGLNNKNYKIDTKKLGRELNRYEPFLKIKITTSKKRYSGEGSTQSTVTTLYHGIRLKTEIDFLAETGHEQTDYDEEIPF
ncbi:MAG: phage/plasmid primase, P4 family [Candidatus Kapabacteria bacterium]|jgi:putative DNA primase/helicase|nr:phage/plasmid primase, P4 family [Candidatus Kapabacteria bacterium]